MSLTSFIKWPKYEEYKEMFKEHLSWRNETTASFW